MFPFEFVLSSLCRLFLFNRRETMTNKKQPDYCNKYHCLVCLTDYSKKRINFGDTCTNPAVNVFDAEAKYLTFVHQIQHYVHLN